MRSSACKTWLGRLTTLLMAFLVSGALAFAQTKTVTGTVVDNYGNQFSELMSNLYGSDGSPRILRPYPQNALDLNNADVAQNPGW